MKAYYEIVDGSIVPATAEEASILVYAAPDEQQRQQILDVLHLDRYDLESVFDPDEISRVEFAPERVSLIWKRPKSAAFDQTVRFDVSSIGLFLRPNQLIIIMSEEVVPFSAKEFQGVHSPIDVLLKFLLQTIHHYLGHLKAVKQLTAGLQSKISASMGNRYLLQMFSLGESLIYYLNAIEANGVVLTKLRSNTDKLGLSKQQLESLDDIVLENQQCSRQAQIYSTVLSDLMDARGTIINNNMNMLLKNLTLINVVFLPLNLIASIGGMSEFSAMTKTVGWKISYSIFSLALLLLGWVTWIILVRTINREQKQIERGGN
jgi:magnesium transporter